MHLRMLGLEKRRKEEGKEDCLPRLETKRIAHSLCLELVRALGGAGSMGIAYVGYCRNSEYPFVGMYVSRLSFIESLFLNIPS